MDIIWSEKLNDTICVNLYFNKGLDLITIKHKINRFVTI